MHHLAYQSELESLCSTWSPMICKNMCAMGLILSEQVTGIQLKQSGSYPPKLEPLIFSLAWASPKAGTWRVGGPGPFPPALSVRVVCARRARPGSVPRRLRGGGALRGPGVGGRRGERRGRRTSWRGRFRPRGGGGGGGGVRPTAGTLW